MRHITHDSCEAFTECREFARSNSEVINYRGLRFTAGGSTYTENCMGYALFGNQIAMKHKDTLTLYDAKHRTRTTKDRLNGLLHWEVGNNFRIFQEKGEWFLTDGETTIQWRNGIEFNLVAARLGASLAAQLVIEIIKD